jgi:hypothetical protein
MLHNSLRLVLLFLLIQITQQVPAQSRESGGGQCRERCGCGYKPNLQGLLGRLHELLDQSKRVQQELHQAIAKRDAARDKIWGSSGSMAQFFNAMKNVGLDGRGFDKSVTTIKSVIQDHAFDLASSGIDTLTEGDIQEVGLDLSSAGTAVSAVKYDALKSRSKSAKQIYKDALSRTGNRKNAANQATTYFLSSPTRGAERALGFLETGLGVFNLGKSFLDFYSMTDAFANDLQAYADAREEVERLEDQRAMIDKMIEQTNREIAKLKAECAGNTSHRSQSPITREPKLMPALYTIQAIPNSPGPDRIPLKDIREAVQEIRALKNSLEPSGVRIDLTDGIAPLYPFWTGTWREDDRQYLTSMIAYSRPALARLSERLQEVSKHVKRVRQLLLQA